MTCHEVDHLGSGTLGGDTKITFIFAVFIIDENQQAAAAHHRQQLLDHRFTGGIFHSHHLLTFG